MRFPKGPEKKTRNKSTTHTFLENTGEQNEQPRKSDSSHALCCFLPLLPRTCNQGLHSLPDWPARRHEDGWLDLYPAGGGGGGRATGWLPLPWDPPTWDNRSRQHMLATPIGQKAVHRPHLETPLHSWMCDIELRSRLHSVMLGWGMAQGENRRDERLRI